MNYLAHAYLSFGKPGITVGNMISDFVKGARKNSYPQDIQNGIQLHRAIDAFTDAHPATAEAKHIFRPAYRLYSSAFVDVVYDHFLASDRQWFQTESLDALSQNTYACLEEHALHLPPAFAAIFPYMKSQNWLSNYQYDWGLEKSFQGLVRRAAYLHDSRPALELFEKNRNRLHACFLQFMPEVNDFAKEFLERLLDQGGQ